MHVVVWLHYNRKLFEARNVVGYEVDHHPSTGPRALQHTGVEMQQLQMHQLMAISTATASGSKPVQFLNSADPFYVLVFLVEATSAFHNGFTQFLIHQINPDIIQFIMECIGVSTFHNYIGNTATGNSSLLHDLRLFLKGQSIKLSDIIMKYRMPPSNVIQ